MGRSVATAPRAGLVLYFVGQSDEDFAREYVEYAIDPDGTSTATTLEEALSWSPDVWSDPREWEWEDFVEGIREGLRERYPSFEDADRWIGSEVHVIAENGHAYVAVSSYCGLFAVSIGAREPDYDYYVHPGAAELSHAWAKRNADGMAEAIRKDVYLEEYGLAARFSNGEALYAKRPA